jgi:predicted RNase H-like nuclease (RuvC/YqgF family)
VAVVGLEMVEQETQAAPEAAVVVWVQGRVVQEQAVKAVRAVRL